MNQELQTIKKIMPNLLQRFDVKKAALFGSFVSGNVTKDSDIDLLVEFKGKKSLLDLVRLKMALEKKINRKADILTYNSLHPLLKEKILNKQQIIL